MRVLFEMYFCIHPHYTCPLNYPTHTKRTHKNTHTHRDDPLLAIAMQLEDIALSDDYFIKRNLYPNVDFYSGIVLRALGIPVSMYTVLFAVARTVGWVSQWKEMVSAADNKITRPRQVCVLCGVCLQCGVCALCVVCFV